MLQFDWIDKLLFLSILGCMFGAGFGYGIKQQRKLPPVELKQFYKIGKDLYKPVEILDCIYLQNYRKSVHAWSLCRNPMHFNK